MGWRSIIEGENMIKLTAVATTVLLALCSASFADDESPKETRRVPKLKVAPKTMEVKSAVVANGAPRRDDESPKETRPKKATSTISATRR